MTKVFEHFNLQLRIYDVFDSLIYKRDPSKEVIISQPYTL